MDEVDSVYIYIYFLNVKTYIAQTNGAIAKTIVRWQKPQQEMLLNSKVFQNVSDMWMVQDRNI